MTTLLNLTDDAKRIVLQERQCFADFCNRLLQTRSPAALGGRCFAEGLGCQDLPEDVWNHIGKWLPPMVAGWDGWWNPDPTFGAFPNSRDPTTTWAWLVYYNLPILTLKVLFGVFVLQLREL